MNHREVGTVEILRERVYPLDPNTGDSPVASTVVVAPGVYPLWRVADATYWMMSGHLNSGGFDKIGDGLFVMRAGDGADGPQVTFPSRRFGPDEWAAFLADPSCVEGDPEQRLRILETVSS